MNRDEMREHARKLVADWPPLTPAQKIRLAVLLRPELPIDAEALPAGPPPQPQPEPRVALYRHYDDAGTLLYIGITNNLGNRTRSHSTNSSWAEFAVRSEAEWWPDRRSAEDAERAAIEQEKPLFNSAYSTPEAREACVRYLIERGRLDLLNVKVSRA